MNCKQLLDKGFKYLKINKILNPKLDSELLLSKVLKKNRSEILINLNKEIDQKKYQEYNIYLSRRKKKNLSLIF